MQNATISRRSAGAAAGLALGDVSNVETAPAAWLLKLLGGSTAFLAFSLLGLTFRRMTANRRTLPKVFILGAPKAGTTSLAVYLASHPAYVPAQNRELTFLQDLPNFQIKYEKSKTLARVWGRYDDRLDSYRKFFPLESVMRRVSRQTRTEALTGDHTPFYLYCPVAQRRIQEISPDARFIVILREPIGRAFSDYKMYRGLEIGEKRTFEDAIQDELDGKEQDFAQRYLHQSIYEPHLRRWMNDIPPERFLVLEASELFDESRETLRRVFDFLGLPPFEPRRFPVLNSARVGGKMHPKTREFLQGFFRPHNEALYQLLGRDLGWERERPMTAS